MCGRYVTARSASELRALFDAADETGGGLRADFNVAPTTDVPAVIATREPAEAGAEAGDGRGQVGGRLRLLHWGLLPPGAKDMEAGARMIDARVETVADKPAYRRAFASRRCLLPADGWYEWPRPRSRRAQAADLLLPRRPRAAGDGRALRAVDQPDRGAAAQLCRLDDHRDGRVRSRARPAAAELPHPGHNSSPGTRGCNPH